MTYENNTKVYNNKTLLGTCMLVYIVCMLSGSDVLGMQNPNEMKTTIINKIVDAVNNNKTLREKMTYTLKEYGIKTENGCLCCKKPIPFDEVTVLTKHQNGGCYNISMHVFLSAIYDIGTEGLELKKDNFLYTPNSNLIEAIDEQISVNLKKK